MAQLPLVWPVSTTFHISSIQSAAEGISGSGVLKKWLQNNYKIQPRGSPVSQGAVQDAVHAMQGHMQYNRGLQLLSSFPACKHTCTLKSGDKSTQKGQIHGREVAMSFAQAFSLARLRRCAQALKPESRAPWRMSYGKMARGHWRIRLTEVRL